MNDPSYCLYNVVLFHQYKLVFTVQGKSVIKKDSTGYGEIHTAMQLSMCYWVSIMFLEHVFHHNFYHRLFATPSMCQPY